MLLKTEGIHLEYSSAKRQRLFCLTFQIFHMKFSRLFNNTIQLSQENLCLVGLFAYLLLVSILTSLVQGYT